MPDPTFALQRYWDRGRHAPELLSALNGVRDEPCGSGPCLRPRGRTRNGHAGARWRNQGWRESAAAVVRELAEESGLSTGRLIRKLGESWFVAPVGTVPAGFEEQVHHVFHIHLDESPATRAWEWDECSDGDVPLHRFAFRWLDLDGASTVLHPAQAMWIPILGCSLEHLVSQA